MALIRTGAMISDITGRVGGNVFQRTKAGLCIRRQAGSINKGLTNLHNTQGFAVKLQQAWAGLNTFQRTAWETYAQYRPRGSRKNIAHKLTGQAVFFLENMIRQQHILQGGTLVTPIETIPTLGGWPATISISSIGVLLGIMTMFTTYQVIDTTKFFMLYITRPLAPSQMSGWNKYKLIAQVTSIGYPQDITVSYTRLFGMLPINGQYVNTRIALYDKTIGTFSNITNQRILVG
jgi:hypothetical protein